jgi:hypothetical protein
MTASTSAIYSGRRRRLWIPSVLLLSLLSASAWNLIIGAQADGGGIHGSIHTALVNRQLGTIDDPACTQADTSVKIDVPQFEVHLVSEASNSVIASTKTDVFGRFQLRYQPVGTFRVCWTPRGGSRAALRRG